ncbi:nuclease-related domain protein [Oxobacter pfennigii]|uniref:Nuclease-related domain protein n=1 Tax=Oxobacter pfennigii TaxID=36849 RepID=A0A0P8W4L1_9CLOT|nr:nuclease-related domain-containing protein [Oxobacter pfennigii]KPU42709.1 nuclease-related domain protein [Oxobacter pfennigii]
MILILLPIIVAIIYFYFDKKKYDKSEYKEASGITYFKAMTDDGYRGENLTYVTLQGIQGYHKTLVNAYIPKEKGGTTELDIVFIHQTGIYVLESKNYSGWIFGNEKNKYWAQTFKTGRKERFANPIWQNNLHINSLSKLLNIDKEYMRSIIVFSQRCTLKSIEINSSAIKVINRNNLIRVINEYVCTSNAVFTKRDIDDFYNIINKFTHASAKLKKEHIKAIGYNK